MSATTEPAPKNNFEVEVGRMAGFLAHAAAAILGFLILAFFAGLAELLVRFTRWIASQRYIGGEEMRS